VKNKPDVHAPTGRCGDLDCRGGDIFPGWVGIKNYPCPICQMLPMSSDDEERLRALVCNPPAEWRRGAVQEFQTLARRALGEIARLRFLDREKSP